MYRCHYAEDDNVQTKRGDPMVSSKQYSICFNDLQVKFVAQSNLEYAILSISQFESLANTPVVTSIKLEIVVFVRKTYWNRNIYRLCLYWIFNCVKIVYLKLVANIKSSKGTVCRCFYSSRSFLRIQQFPA